MKKIVSLLLLILLGTTVYYAQVGVNTENPQATFHIDGAKDNPDTGTPTTAQQANDVVINSAGNLGLGIINPTTKLDIDNGTTAGALKIQDGTQGNGKILTSDANGVATWQTSPNSFTFNDINELTIPVWSTIYGPTTRLTVINGPIVSNVSNNAWYRAFIEISKNGTSNWIRISEAISQYPNPSSFYIPGTLTGWIPVGWYYRITRENTAIGFNGGRRYELY
jgi:hypothetical protein